VNGVWVDVILIACWGYFLIDGIKKGFFLALIELIGFLLSLVGAFLWYDTVGSFLFRSFVLARSFSNALSFLLLGVAIESMIYFFAGYFLTRIPRETFDAFLYRVLGFLPGFLKGFVLSLFFLTLVINVPIGSSVRQDIIQSHFAPWMLSQASSVEYMVNKVFGQAIQDTMTFLTIRPQSDEVIDLRFKLSDMTVDAEAEQELFRLVNEERTKRGLTALTFNTQISLVARKHSADMFARGYFAHINPERETPADRLRRGSILFVIAGENLALAPDTGIAHTGLMNSEGHRANILSPDYSRIGIGVVDGGMYGKMYTQNFAD